ncbi:hypothetical protein ACFWIA_28665 [Streptomyces sp. NPDC127068]
MHRLPRHWQRQWQEGVRRVREWFIRQERRKLQGIAPTIGVHVR